MTHGTPATHSGDFKNGLVVPEVDSSAFIGQLGLEAGTYWTGLRHRFSTGANELLREKENPMKTAEDLGAEYEKLLAMTNLGNSAIATGLYIESYKVAGGNFLERNGEVLFSGEAAPHHLSPKKEFYEVIFIEKLLRRGNKYRPIKIDREKAGFPNFGSGNIDERKDSIFIKREYLGPIHIALLQKRGIQMEIFMDKQGDECVRLVLTENKL